MSIAIQVRVHRVSVTTADEDDEPFTFLQYGVAIDQNRTHVLDAPCREPVMSRDPELGTVTCVVEWNRPRTVSGVVHATSDPDGRLDAPVALTVRVVEFNAKLQTFRDVAVGQQVLWYNFVVGQRTFNHFITESFMETIAVTPDIFVSIEVTLAFNESDFPSQEIDPAIDFAALPEPTPPNSPRPLTFHVEEPSTNPSTDALLQKEPEDSAASPEPRPPNSPRPLPSTNPPDLDVLLQKGLQQARVEIERFRSRLASVGEKLQRSESQQWVSPWVARRVQPTPPRTVTVPPPPPPGPAYAKPTNRAPRIARGPRPTVPPSVLPKKSASAVSAPRHHEPFVTHDVISSSSIITPRFRSHKNFSTPMGKATKIFFGKIFLDSKREIL